MAKGKEKAMPEKIEDKSNESSTTGKDNSKNKKVKYTMNSQMRTLAIKIYEEQMPDGWDATIKAIKNIDKNNIQVFAICHDKDTMNDDIWKPAKEKKHYHIWMRVMNNKKFRVHQLLEIVKVRYREELDDTLWKNHGVESCRDYAACAMYATHESEDAVCKGKLRYDIKDVVSNLSTEEFKAIREGYCGANGSKGQVSLELLMKLDSEAKKIGYQMGDFDSWFDHQPFLVRSSSKIKSIKESYLRGVAERIEEDDRVNRLCIFIQGKKNSGKTYAAMEALKGNKILTVGGGGTGKFDNLTVTTNVIIIDDDKCPNLLNMTDNYIRQAYRRQNNNPWWCGEYFVVTSNLSFDEWLEECGINVKNGVDKKSEHYYAMLSRFYVCFVCKDYSGKTILHCSSPSKRGNKEEQENRKAKYIDFRDKFEKSIQEYTPELIDVDYTDINVRTNKDAIDFENDDLSWLPFQ